MALRKISGFSTNSGSLGKKADGTWVNGGMSASFYIDDDALNRFNAATSRIVINNISNEVINEADRLVEDWRVWSRKSKPGESIRENWRISPVATGLTKNSFFGSVSNTAKHAQFYHNGTPPHDIAPRGFAMLIPKSETNRNYAGDRYVDERKEVWVVRRTVKHPGAEPRPFLAEAANKVMSRRLFTT